MVVGGLYDLKCLVTTVTTKSTTITMCTARNCVVRSRQELVPYQLQGGGDRLFTSRRDKLLPYFQISKKTHGWCAPPARKRASATSGLTSVR